MVKRIVNWKWYAALAVLALASTMIFVTNRAAKGQYNVYSGVVRGNTTEYESDSMYPRCDNGFNYYLRYVFEWAQGNRMVRGSDCTIATISSEEVAKRMDQWLIKHNINPAKATAQQLTRAEQEVLREWVNSVFAH